MDLTPPSLTYSPSPSHQDITSSPSSCALQSPRIGDVDSTLVVKHRPYYHPANLLTIPYKPASPHGSLYSSPVLDHLDSPDSFPHFDRMSQTTWNTASPLMPSSTIISATSHTNNAISAKHNPLTTYESGLRHSYGSGQNYRGNYPQQHVDASTILEMASPALGASAESPNPDTVKAAMNYSPNDGAKFQTRNLPYNAGLGGTLYPIPGLPRDYCTNDAPPFAHPTSQPALAEISHLEWKRGHDTMVGFYPLPPYEAPGSRPPINVMRPSPTPRAAKPLPKRRRHTNKEEANFQCQVKGCGKFFSRSYNFKSHMETHDERREYPFLCQETNCDKKFVRKTDLQRHHQSVHAKEKNHRCDYCGRMFARKDTLRRHMEDGCSKRFDVGTLAVRPDNYSTTKGSVPIKPSRSDMSPTQPMTTSLTTTPVYYGSSIVRTSLLSGNG